jgi:DNA-binding NtrC family response regulator
MKVPITVLVVEDDESVRTLLECALQTLGTRVLSAANGMEAIDLFQQVPVSVVLMDVEMPGLDGPDTLKHMQSIRPVACVFMTSGSRYSTDELLKLGACDVIRKPFGKFDKLIEILKDCFEKEAIKHSTHLPRSQLT